MYTSSSITLIQASQLLTRKSYRGFFPDPPFCLITPYMVRLKIVMGLNIFQVLGFDNMVGWYALAWMLLEEDNMV